MSNLAELASMRSKFAAQAMLVVGLPCSLTYITSDLIRDMLTRKYGTCFAFSLNRESVNSLDFASISADSYLGVVDAPDDFVFQTIEELALPTIVIDQSFSDACVDFASRRDVDFASAVRTMTWVHCGIDRVKRLSQTRLVHASKNDKSEYFASNFIDSFLEGERSVKLIVEERLRDKSFTSLIRIHFGDAVSRHRREDLESAEHFERFFQGSFDVLQLPMQLFFEGNPPYGPMQDSLELLGPARCLVYGPYICLPTGRWDLEISFSAHLTHGSNKLGVDIVEKGQLLGQCYFEILRSGTYSLTLPFTVENPLNHLEFRILLSSGSIGGELSKISANVKQMKRA
jgi:hypothetical protein